MHLSLAIRSLQNPSQRIIAIAAFDFCAKPMGLVEQGMYVRPMRVVRLAVSKAREFRRRLVCCCFLELYHETSLRSRTSAISSAFILDRPMTSTGIHSSEKLRGREEDQASRGPLFRTASGDEGDAATRLASSLNLGTLCYCLPCGYNCYYPDRMVSIPLGSTCPSVCVHFLAIQ